MFHLQSYTKIRPSDMSMNDNDQSRQFGTSCRAKTILQTSQPLKKQQVNASGQKALFSPSKSLTYIYRQNYCPKFFDLQNTSFWKQYLLYRQVNFLCRYWCRCLSFSNNSNRQVHDIGQQVLHLLTARPVKSLQRQIDLVRMIAQVVNRQFWSGLPSLARWILDYLKGKRLQIKHILGIHCSKPYPARTLLIVPQENSWRHYLILHATAKPVS